MAVPFTLTGSLSFPPDDGVAPAERLISAVGSFESKAEFTLKLTGTGTQVVHFGTIDTNGAKAVQIEVDVGAVAPVLVRFNGSVTGGLQLSAGGGFTYANPTPDTDGVLSMEIDHTDAATVKVTVLG